MRKILKALLSLLVICIIIGVGLMHFVLPAQVERQSRSIMESMGMYAQEIHLPAPEVSFGSLRYRDIILDADEVSVIDELLLSYDPISFLIFGQLSGITITGLQLTGEFFDGVTTIAGLRALPDPRILHSIKTRSLRIKDARISLMTDEFGGVNIQYAMLARRKVNGFFDYQDQISSSQKGLSFIASSQGIIAPDFWNTEIKIERAKLSLPKWKSQFTRISGVVNISQEYNAPITMLGDFQAGGLRLMNSPWHNGKIAIERSLNIDTNTPESRIFISAQSLNRQGLELSLEATHSPKQQIPLLNVQINAQKAKHFINYLTDQKIIPRTNTPLNLLSATAGEMNFGFTLTDIKDGIYSLNYDLQNGYIKGVLDFDTKTHNLNATMNGEPVMIADTADNLSALRSGIYSLIGDIEMTQDGTKSEISARLKDISLRTPLGILSDINGDLHLQEDSFGTLPDQTLPCSFTLARRCILSLMITEDKGVILGDISMEFLGGRLTLDSLSMDESDQKLALHFDNIAIKNLLSAMGFTDIKGTGKLSGTLPILIKDGDITVPKASMKNSGPGIISYMGEVLPDANRGALGQEALRLALSHFEYSELRVELSGGINGSSDNQLNATITVTGRSPNLSTNAPITLNFTVPIDMGKILSRYSPK